MWTSALAPLTLDLVQQGDVLIEVDEAQEGNELVHDWFFKINLDAECTLH